ncbi:aryl-alcohol dehydrogenase-like predicted oxidoreductase [Algoriphagus iocasae]|uniref:Aryl-alcohol dehydrogenase-like predicted oxidoreductase n=1 Tax=Algoriphagus iocasae TaxID=1836499 RepID=A0A841MND1_9BACT|nr:aldo/keto reductase [Algoriphagus iocasae]MBB6327009.1 aryl-alcohol dehydrogenase-like predicted oxidoreductase [Algoriphagus iocasae]
MINKIKSNRREFFKSAALAGAGLVMTPTLAMSSGDKPRLNASAALPTRKLGGLEVSGIGLGCMSMVAGTYNPTPPKQDMIAHLRKAVERGVTFFDTAEVYGPYGSEEVVGEGLEPFKGQIKIATKIGFEIQNSQRMGRNSSPESLKRVVDGSLKRLRVETIDLLYLHRWDPQVPVEEIAGAFKEIIAAGKAKHWGLSEVAPDTLRKAHAELPVSALQTQYSLGERFPENQILDTCEELGVGFVPWGPTLRSFLTGRFNEYSRFDELDRRSQLPFFSSEGLEQNMPFLRIVQEWSQKKGITMAQFSLAWLLAQKPFIVPIPGTISPQHLEENLGALEVRFSESELTEIRSEIEKFDLLGVRTKESALVDQ